MFSLWLLNSSRLSGAIGDWKEQELVAMHGWEMLDMQFCIGCEGKDYADCMEGAAMLSWDRT